MFEFAPVIAIAGSIFTTAWKFHNVYVNFHKEFKDAVDKSTEKLEFNFGFNLYEFFSKFSEKEKETLKKEVIEKMDKNEIAALLRSTRSYSEDVKKLYESAVKAENPKRSYENTRDRARDIYTTLLFDGAIALLGLVPAVLQIQGVDFLYYLFLFPLVVVFSNWLEYNRGEKTLVEIRDSVK